MNPASIRIGQCLMVTPIAVISHNIWHVECSGMPDNWSCKLLHRSSTDLIQNTPLLSWVLVVNIETYRLEVSDSNFGFLPISDRMRPRYVAALRHVATVLRNGDACQVNPDHFSEVKGMYSRCLRRDQWDWRAVQIALGEPSPDLSRTIAATLGQVAAAIRSGNNEEAGTGLAILRGHGISPVLEKAEVDIADSALRLVNVHSPSVRQHDRLKQATVAPQKSVLSVYSKQKLDSANTVHAELLEVLTDYLGAYGHRIESNQFVDAFTNLKSGPAIFEAKSLTDTNEISQVRHGLSQLYEYRFRHGLTDASLWLLLSRKLKEKWLVDYLEEDRKIHVLWIEDGQLSGPSYSRLLESGSDALRRNRDAR